MDQINHLLSALLGTAVSVYITRLYILKVLRDLETALKMGTDMRLKLTEIEVKLEVLEPIQVMVQDHEKKLYAMRSKSGRASSRDTNGGS